MIPHWKRQCLRLWPLVFLFCIYLLFLFTSVLPLPFFIKLFFSFYCIILFPGYLIFYLFMRHEGICVFEQIFVSFGFGLGFITLPGLAGYIGELSLSTIYYSVVLITFGLAFVALYATFSSKNYRQPKTLSVAPKSTALKKYLIYSAMFLLIAFSSLLGYAYSTSPSGDIWYNIAVNREMLALDSLSPFVPILNIREIDSSYSMNSFFIVTSLMIRNTGIDSMPFNVFLPILFLPLYIISFFSLVKGIFEEDLLLPYIASITGFIFFFFGPLQDLILVVQMSAFQRYVLVYAAYPLLVYFTFKYLYSRKKKYLYITSALVFCYSWLHSLALFFYFSFLVFFALGWLFFNYRVTDMKNSPHLFQFIRLFILSAILSLPVVVLRFSSYKIGLPLVNTYPTQLFLTPHMFMINPYSFLKWSFLLAFLACFFVFSRRKTLWGSFLLSLYFIPLIIFLFPPFITLLSDILFVAYVVKLEYIIPLSILISYGFYMLLSAIFRRVRYFIVHKREWLTIITPLFILVLLIAFIPVSHNLVKKGVPLILTPKGITYDSRAIFMQNNLLPGRVLLASDVIASLSLSSVAPIYVVSVYGGHFPTLNLSERNDDTSAIYATTTDIDRTLFLLGKYNVSYVYVRLALEDPAKFLQDKKHFSILYQDEDSIIFVVTYTLK